MNDPCPLFDAETMRATERPPPPSPEWWLVMAYHGFNKYWSLRPGGPYPTLEETEKAAESCRASGGTSGR